jgi:Tfp pilus assembly protein PilE
MNETIIVAVLAVLSSAFSGAFAAIVASSRSGARARAEAQVQAAETRLEITHLRQQVEKHNGLVERMVAVEASTRSAHLRINELGAKL